jgi:hypothetical protein
MDSQNFKDGSARSSAAPNPEPLPKWYHTILAFISAIPNTKQDKELMEAVSEMHEAASRRSGTAAPTGQEALKHAMLYGNSQPTFRHEAASTQAAPSAQPKRMMY